MLQSYVIRVVGYVIVPTILAVGCYFIAANYALSEPVVAKAIAVTVFGALFSMFDFGYRAWLSEDRLKSPIFIHKDIPTLAYIPYWVFGLIVAAAGIALMFNP